jgi:hypothetical protein
MDIITVSGLEKIRNTTKMISILSVFKEERKELCHTVELTVIRESSGFFASVVQELVIFRFFSQVSFKLLTNLKNYLDWPCNFKRKQILTFFHACEILFPGT